IHSASSWMIFCAASYSLPRYCDPTLDKLIADAQETADPAMRVKLYEDIVHHGRIATTYDYPVIVNGRYLSSPSPIPKFDNPKLHMNPALQLFGAGRERRIYAIAPYTPVASLDFDDHPFEVQRWDAACALCGSRESFLDEMIVDDHGTRRFVCSDSDYCSDRRGGRCNSRC
ncbi:alpha-D-ribose 1-methylphosphonate 5-phosphate C-P-lyase PhnJ, partial [Burkholderia thailandensis]|uniref:alpha-D-ribose 1-methylphosphonate 5-phosphate C-P-lyase PhnJ n=1 Tax=Burkholderia thailandensis TaxID=57975 RepID=UPI00217DEAA3